MNRLTSISHHVYDYQHARIVLWGAGKYGKTILSLLHRLGVNVSAICDNNQNLWGTFLEGVPILSPDGLKNMLLQHDNIIVQISILLEDDNELVHQLQQLGVKNYIPLSDTRLLFELHNRIQVSDKNIPTDITEPCDDTMLDVNLLDLKHMLHHKIKFTNTIADASIPNPILCCFPLESDPHVVRYLLHNAYIHDFDSYPQSFDKKILDICNTKVKLITAVRDPVAQNLSFTYNIFRHGSDMAELCFLQLSDRYNLQENYTEQDVFNAWMSQTKYMDTPSYNTHTKTFRMPRMIQHFIPEFCSQVLNIMQSPFDKQKGYSVARSENIEVFVYQYERHADILPEIAAWLGIPDNTAMSIPQTMYTGNALNLSPSKINLPESYINKCYNEPYVQHFYTNEDINCFKEKWK